MKTSILKAVSVILAVGTVGACSGGADLGGRDASTADASADPVFGILARPHVQEALAAAAAAGFPIASQTKTDPPAITGYYLKPLGEGRFVASGNGANLTSTVAGDELRVTVRADSSVTVAAVGFNRGVPIGSSLTDGQLLRGSNGDFTLYQSYTTACPYQADRTTEGVSIQSGQFVEATGDWQTVRQITITVAASGPQTADCDEAYVGDTEVPGGWFVAEVPRYQRITVADLEYMCVDEDKGYVAGEGWTEADGTACFCTSDLLVECD